MNEKLVRYLLDTTGSNPDNLVKGEVHLLSKHPIRVISPLYGAFYSDSVKIYDNVNKRYLEHDVDYCSAGLLQTESAIFGQSITSVILILSKAVSDNVSITYQTLGGDLQRNNRGLEALLKYKEHTHTNYSFKDIKDLPKGLKPTFHLHDIGDIYGFEYILFLLEKLRISILWADSTLIYSLTARIQQYLDSLLAKSFKDGNDIFNELVISFKKNFTKDGLGLGLIKNQGLLTKEEVEQAFNEARIDILTDAYFHLKALDEFKSLLYSTIVRKDKTNLGLFSGVTIVPVLQSLHDATNGSVYLVDSLNVLEFSGIDYNKEIIPDLSKTTTNWVIKKISNLTDEKGGIFLSIAVEDNTTYVGKLTVNSLNELTLVWKELVKEDKLELLDNLDKHKEDFANPHKDHKSKINLGEVENLPVATREEIVCNVPLRKYITQDILMLYMKRFLTGEKSIHDIDLVEDEKNTMRRMQAIFSPCGSCNTRKDEWSLVENCVGAPEAPSDVRATLDANTIYVHGEEGYARLIAYLDKFLPNKEVIIKIYREINDPKPQVPIDPDPNPDPPVDPNRPTYYYVTWTDCAIGEAKCDEASILLEAGDPFKDKPRAWNLAIGYVISDRGEVMTNVEWEITKSPFVVFKPEDKQIIDQMPEVHDFYQVEDGKILANPGILDDTNVKYLYGYVDHLTALRTYSFTAKIDGVVIGTLTYTHQLKIEFKSSGGRYDGGKPNPFQ